MNKTNPFENEIFDHYRQRAIAINKAIELLIEHNYTIIDLEGKFITKDKINLNFKESSNYRIPKLKEE